MPLRTNSRFTVLIALSWPSQIGTAVRIRIGSDEFFAIQLSVILKAMPESIPFDRALDFSGKTALVTGSSRGIGAAILTALGRAGAKCIVNYFEDPEGRNRADAQTVAKEIGEHTTLVECDISDAEDVTRMA